MTKTNKKTSRHLRKPKHSSKNKRNQDQPPENASETKIRFESERQLTRKPSEYQLRTKRAKQEFKSVSQTENIAQTSNLDVDLLETVVQIIDYTEIPELLPINNSNKKKNKFTKKKCILKRKKNLKKQEKHRKPLLVSVESQEQLIIPEDETKPNRITQEPTITRTNRSLIERDSILPSTKIFLEEDMNCERYHWTTRGQYIASMGTSALQRVINYIKVLLSHGKTEDAHFTSFEFAVMLLLHEFNLTNSGSLGENFIKYGTGPTMIAHTFFLFCVEMPFLMKIMTMASFSQTYIVRFFRSVPLLQGIGYCTLFLYLAFQTEVAFYFEGAFRILLFLMTTTSEWKNCPFIIEDYKCIPFGGYSSIKEDCNISVRLSGRHGAGSEYYATQYFMNHIIFTPDNVDLPWYVNHGTVIIWLAVLLIALNGITLIKKVTVRLQVAMFIVPGGMTIFVLGYRIYSIYKGQVSMRFNYVNWSLILSPEFLIDSIAVSTKIYHLPYLVWVCAMKPKNASTEVYSALIVFLGVLMSWGFASLHISSVEIICTTYHINPTCLHLFTRDNIFSLLPDLLLHVSFAKSWLFLWFFSVLYYYAIYVVYAINVTVDSIVQCLPSLNKVPLLFSVGVWLSILVFRYLRLCSNCHNVFEFIKPEKFGILCTILFGVLAYGLQFFYGQDRFRDDFMFYTNRRPKKIWAITWHIIVYLSGIGLVCAIFEQCLHASNIDDSDGTVFALFELTTSFMAFFIILYFFIQRYCYWLYIKRARESFNPDPIWGSPDPKMILLRKVYFSERDIRLRRNKLVCTHRCLFQTTQFKHVGYTQLVKHNRIKQISSKRRK